MLNPEWIDVFRLIPPEEHTKLIIALQNGTELSVDTLIRFEPHFLLMRGRVAGTIDEARGFFVPYSQMLYVRLERVVSVEEMDAMFPHQIIPLAEEVKGAHETAVLPPSERPTPTVPTDPATASRLLMERIRAMRASSAERFPSQM
jgi:hypothetical protein